MNTQKHLKTFLLAAGLGAALLGAAVNARAEGQFRITTLQVAADGSAAVAWSGQDKQITVQYTGALTPPVWRPVPGVNWPIDGTSWTGLIPAGGKGFLRVVTVSGQGTVPVPAKTISLNLVGWHDPQSNSYVSSCTACHGDRTNEVAQDGVTLGIHSLPTHRTLAGEGDAGCIKCHQRGTPKRGPDFLTYSLGALREQVNMEENLCTTCHAKGSSVPLFDR